MLPPEIGGPATYVQELVKRIGGVKVKGLAPGSEITESHKFLIVTLTQNPELTKNVIVIRSKLLKIKPFSTFIKSVKLFFNLAKERRNYDIAYIQVPDLFGFFSLISLKILNKPAILKFVGDVSWEYASNRGETSKFLDNYLEEKKFSLSARIINNIQRTVLSGVDSVITPSKYLKEILCTFYNIEPSKVTTIYNAVDIEECQKIERKKENDSINFSGNKHQIQNICYVGRLTPWKGIEGLIAAFKEVNQVIENTRLLLVGDGPIFYKKKLEKTVKELRLDGKVLFLGKKSHKEALSIIRSSELFILNSKYEGLPHVVIEAMACKTPVIATKIKGTQEVIGVNDIDYRDEGKFGTVVDIGDNKQLSKRIMEVLFEKPNPKKKTIIAHKMIEKRFSWDSNIKNLEKVFKNFRGER